MKKNIAIQPAARTRSISYKSNVPPLKNKNKTNNNSISKEVLVRQPLKCTNIEQKMLNNQKNDNSKTLMSKNLSTTHHTSVNNNPNQFTNTNHFQSNLSNLQQKQAKPLMQRLDNEFVKVLTQLQTYYTQLNKHQQIRVQKWIVKIIQNDQTIRWKLNRNNYLKLLSYVVKNYGTLIEPFDKMPDLTKDLTYLSEHDLNQKIKPKFDGKSPAFHVQKPEMIKIDEPVGDSCSVLMSLINTARTNISKENNCQQQQQNQTFKQSKLLIDDQYNHYFTNKNSRKDFTKKQYKSQDKQNRVQKSNIDMINKLVKRRERQQYQNQQDPTHFDHPSEHDINTSSVIPSNLPSQVKSTIQTNPKNNDSNKNNKQLCFTDNKNTSNPKYNYHQKYSCSKNSIISRHHTLGQNCNKSTTSFVNAHPPTQNQQLTIYKQLVLVMGRLLLKHQFTIQRQSQYWRLMRMIYEYQQSFLVSNQQNNDKKCNEISCPESKNDTDRYENNGMCYQSDRVQYRRGQMRKGRKGERKETFQEFLSRLRVEIEQGNLVNGNNSSQVDRGDQQFILPSNKNTNNTDPLAFDHYIFKTGKNSSTSYINNPSQAPHNALPILNSNTNNIKRKLYKQQQTFQHITEQSADFKVEEGVLYFQLNDTQRRNDKNLDDEEFNMKLEGNERRIGHLRNASNYQDAYFNRNQQNQKYQQQQNQYNQQQQQNYQQNNRYQYENNDQQLFEQEEQEYSDSLNNNRSQKHKINAINNKNSGFKEPYPEQQEQNLVFSHSSSLRN